MTRPLLTAPRSAAVVTIAAWTVLVGMALWLRDSRNPTALDRSVGTWLYDHLGTGAQQITLALTDPLVTVGGCAAITVIALFGRRWNVAVLASVGPLLGLVLESHVLKPAIDRRFGIAETLSGGAVKAGYAFPSGHETGLTSLTALVVILTAGSAARRSIKITVYGVTALWTLVGAIGLVRSGYHYATDTIGGVALGVGVMVWLALLLDAARRRLSSPAGLDRARTAPAA